MKQYLFYQHNVQQFFIRHADKYAGVTAPLSIATSFPEGTVGFLQALFAKDPKKEFFIDPRSPLFQHNWDRDKFLRDPHKKMAAVFGEPFSTIGLKSKLEPAHFPDKTLEAVTTACMKYQDEFRLQQSEKKKIEKYKKLLGVDEMPQITNPQVFLPPYFEFSNCGDAWYKLSLQSIVYAAKVQAPARIRPVLHFSKFGDNDWKGTIDALKGLGIKSVLLYPNDFQEHKKSADELTRYAKAVQTFAESGIEPYTLHGGYYAIAMEKKGLVGFGNGIGYGEWRDSGYHRGGTAETRIYVPRLHRFLESAKVQALMDYDSDAFSADSTLLQTSVANARPIQSISLEEALDHFMECRKAELEFVSKNTQSEIAAELTVTIKVLQKMGDLGKDYLSSLTVWREAINGQ